MCLIFTFSSTFGHRFSYAKKTLFIIIVSNVFCGYKGLQGFDLKSFAVDIKEGHLASCKSSSIQILVSISTKLLIVASCPDPFFFTTNKNGENQSACLCRLQLQFAYHAHYQYYSVINSISPTHGMMAEY